MNKVKLCIVHYNTPKLTECLIKSVNKFTPDCEIYVFDNSDKNPFSYRQDNIHYIDNTKGQIINFDEWLKHYPLRYFSAGINNNFVSCKHCYSVEKCMEKINDNFILLDSDVLLKRDISSLYDDRFMYMGEVEKQDFVNMYRLLPYICFINVNECKKLGIHYFYGDKMHGLNVSGTERDWYDTGAAFYNMTKEYAHKDIIIEDYVEHFKGGSWEDKEKKNNVTDKEWLNKFSYLWKK